MFQVTVAPRGLSFETGAESSILEAALRSGVLLPNSCRNGTCRTCLCVLREGSVSYRIEWPGLSVDEKREGYILPCVAIATSDLVIDSPAAKASEQAQVIHKYIAAYNAFDIEGMLALLSPDVRFENWSSGQLTAAASGIDEFGQLARQSKAMFSEREQRITSLAQGAESILVHIAYRGRLAVDIPNGPRAGTLLELAGESEFTFHGPLISRIVDRQ